MDGPPLHCFPAELWQRGLALHRVPLAWLRGRTCLLWKAITVSLGQSQCCRSFGSQVPNCSTKLWEKWSHSWHQAFDCGGLPCTSMGAALQHVQRELANRCQGAIQQDVAGFFDSLDHRLTLRVLRHLRAPECFVSLFASACAQGRRLFSLDGALGAGWRQPQRGLPQGCPLSPWCLQRSRTRGAATCSAPRTTIATSSLATVMSMIGSLCLGLKAPFSVAQGTFQCAISRSDHYDQTFGLEVSITKCARFWLRKAVLRLRSLRLSTMRARHMVRSLVMPCVTWAAAYAVPCVEDIHTLHAEVQYTKQLDTELLKTSAGSPVGGSANPVAGDYDT